jgi:hypothetical protein
LAKPTSIPKDAEGTTVYLTPEEQVVLKLVTARRKKRRDIRRTQNEVLVDGLWHMLTEVEGIPRETIENLLKVESNIARIVSNITEFPKK